MFGWMHSGKLHRVICGWLYCTSKINIGNSSNTLAASAQAVEASSYGGCYTGDAIDFLANNPAPTVQEIVHQLFGLIRMHKYNII
jgi:hypothetical protein